jgi:hypothetical protein
MSLLVSTGKLKFLSLALPLESRISVITMNNAMKYLSFLKLTLPIASMAITTVAYGQVTVVVIPMIDEKVEFSGVGKTGNIKCSEFADPPGGWIEVSPCTSLTSSLRGQDAELMAGVGVTPRYTNNGDGSVTDNLTQLIWLREAFCAQAAVDWPTALAYIIELNSSGTMNSRDCNDTGNNGSNWNDWRLANVKELQALVNYGHHASPFVSDTNGNGHYAQGDPFLNLKVDEAYWSSTSYGIVLDDAVRVNFDDGSTDWTSKKALQHVWAVRGRH